VSFAAPRDAGRRLAGFAAVVALHVALAYALVHGLARKVVEVVRTPFQTRIIEEVAPPPAELRPPPRPKLAPPALPYIPPPEIRISPPPAALPGIVAVTPVKPAEPAQAPATEAAPAAAEPPAKPRPPVRLPAVVDARACDKPAYPPASLRANETGTVRLGFLIDVDGKVLEGRIERSSGHRRLDNAALNALGLCRFRPATVDGRPERTWARIDYEWRIEP
jgi:periplasmic protein TonB